MDEEYLEGRLSAKHISCCPVPFLNTSPGRAVTNSNLLFSHDPKAPCNKQAGFGMEWDPGFLEGSERDLERKVRIDKGEEDDEGQQGGSCSHVGVLESLKCWKSNFSSLSICGVVCSPLLTSRLALTGLLAVLLIVMTVLTWVFTSSNVQHSVKSIAAEFRHELLLHIEDALGNSLQSNNASSFSLARFIGSLSLLTQAPFSSLEDQVRPALFLVFSILGRKTHVSFYAKSGFFFTYAADASGTFLMYANTSYLVPMPFNPNASHVEIPWKEGENLVTSRPWYRWYRQRIDENTGVPIGESLPIMPSAYWDIEPMKSALNGQNGSAVLAPALGYSRELLLTFHSTVRQSSLADPFGMVSVGLPLTSMGSMFDQFDPRGGAVYLTLADGRLVAQSGGFIETNDDSPNNVTQGLYFAAQSSNTVVAAAAEYLHSRLPSIIALQNGSFTASMDLKGVRYLIDSAPIHLHEESLICVVVIPHLSIWRMTEKRSHITLAVLVALATCMGLVGCFFVILLTKGVSNEMRLRAALIQQLEETKSAETKSSHKSLVFANMSHDLRTPLAAILGLIDLCLSDAAESSELETNLLQMKSCASNLLGILNTILDMSKIEAGKLSLQESEFDLVNALEEVVDTFSVVGFKKGVEVALDLSDGSVEKVSCIIGDVGRVKQIMANLLSNGVKFTSEGHVILRAWVKPLGLSVERPPFSYKGRFQSWPWNQLLRSPSRHKEICKLITCLSEKTQDHNDYVQIEFEVDDTGRGIPKERWKSVFENFVQIESSGPRNYDGTGLGLGIVRSMVRLMGGDISIIDKDEPGEPGTRFRFNLIFKCRKQKSAPGDEQRYRHGISLDEKRSIQASFGVNSTSASSGWRINPTAIPVFGDVTDSGLMSPLAMEGVYVLLAVKGQGGRRIVKKWMERRGLQVWTIGDWEEFAPTVERIKQEMLLESLHNSGRFEPISPESHIYDSWVDDFDTKSLGRSRASIDTSLHQQTFCGTDSPVHAVPMQTLNGHEARAYLLVVVDISMVTALSEALCSDIEDMLLETDRLIPYRIVWLVNPNTPSVDIQFLKSQSSACNLILHKPLYASRLQCMWQLLEELVGNRMQEYKGEVLHVSPQHCRKKVNLDAANTLYTSLSCMNTFRGRTSPKADMYTHSHYRSELSLLGDTRTFKPLNIQTNQEFCETVESSLTSETDVERRLPLATSPDQSKPESKVHKARRHSKEMPRKFQHALSSMHILVAEDNSILQRLTKTQLVRLGATVECVDNGAEAVRLVLDNLYRNKVSSAPQEGCQDGEHQEFSKSTMKQPFDLVVMDCEMPVLNGYEATQRIRSVESRYGIRTPVIALTAHAMAQDEKKCIEAGMDFYLTKPLATDALLDVVNKIKGERKP
ncbi:hypothetical protein GOP47_0003432 [Adiantum capillus-veneris]|uniref:histidine kinase n=1 Tax=Adiantum capillus-veneris TaxID=13818 RepID=A0A9D4ZPJ1_ADICA|nr:hypothetical protein GOP47_0002837 [Adiantum capillus-veneris]KAI5083689.1 hypothetical protein GOP47_0003432 [Adiantum capillus-veneris]